MHPAAQVSHFQEKHSRTVSISRKQRIRGSVKRKQKKQGLAVFEEPTFPMPRQRFTAVVGEDERQFLLKGCYPAASIPFEARHGPDTSFNGAKWLATVSRAEHES